MTILIIISIIIFGFCLGGGKFLERLIGVFLGALIFIAIIVLILLKISRIN